MFDENFSFLSSTSNTTSLTYADCTSSDVSPFTSRSSSPRPYFRNSSMSIRSAHDLSRRDSRFNSITSIPSSVSITALTTQLENHALSSDSSSTLAPSPSPTATTPPYSDFSDEGFVDGPTPSDPDLDYESTLWDPDFNITGSSGNYAGADNFPSFALRRRQRQALARFQCVAQRAPDLMMLVDECHPSSMPLPEEPSWSGGPKKKHSLSTSSLSARRVEKERSPCVSVKRSPRMRKRSTR